MFRGITFGIFIGMVALGSADAATIYVPDDYPTIQGAIDAAAAGDTIIVRSGTYVENIDFVGKAIKVKSERGPEATIIDGNRAGSVVTFQSGEDDSTAIEGFTITNGDAGSGGGIYISFAYPDILGNVITGNDADYGGGLYGYVCDSYIDGNTVIDNTAVAGGGLCCQWSTPLIRNNMIAGNSSGWSGGIELYESYSEVVNNTITENSAGNSGGGLYCWGNSAPLVVNTILWNNTSPAGPEIWIGKTDGPSIVTIRYCNVQGGQSSVYVDPGCSLNWGAGMIDLDPLLADLAAGDLHLTFPSPCRDTGDGSASCGDHDFERDPRQVQAAPDMGADEFSHHLYHVGAVVPGGGMDMKVVGPPGASPVRLALSYGILDPPQTTPYGNLYMILPLYFMMNLGTIPSNGVLAHSATVPLVWNPGEEKPFQALIGPLAPGSVLTNLMVLTVE